MYNSLNYLNGFKEENKLSTKPISPSKIIKNISDGYLEHKLDIFELGTKSCYEKLLVFKELQNLQNEVKVKNEDVKLFKKDIDMCDESIEKAKNVILPQLNENLQKYLVKKEKTLKHIAYLMKGIKKLEKERRRSGFQHVVIELARLEELLSLKIDFYTKEKEISFSFSNIDPNEPLKPYLVVFRFLSLTSLHLQSCNPVVNGMDVYEKVELKENWQSFLINIRNTLKESIADKEN